VAFLSSLDIAGSGITAQKKRMDIITENIVNRETTRTEEGGPYRRKLAVFREIEGQNTSFTKMINGSLRKQGGSKGGVMVSEIIEDDSELIPVYDPTHPDANEEGYVMMPNVDTTTEMVDAMAASRSYSANIAAFEAIKSMAREALELGK
jgi:flagellar basal-body rod protein FlgC